MAGREEIAIMTALEFLGLALAMAAYVALVYAGFWLCNRAW